MLVLDEPTNHLDIPSRESLENALDEYDGTIITVSHDRFFLDKIANHILAFEDDGTVTYFDGNYTDFHDWHSGSTTGLAAKPHISQSILSAPETAAAGPAVSKNQREKIEKQIANIEAEISTLEKTSADLARETANPKIAGDYPRLKTLTDQITETDTKIKSLYEQWESLSADLSR